MKLSIVIPVYRGKEILFELTNRIRETLLNRYDFEVIYICDHCDEESGERVKQLQADDPDHIRAYFCRKNYGQHKALQFGLGKAKGDFIVTMDEDLQHDPADITRLLEKQMEGDYDLVYGRFTSLQHKGIRNRLSIILRKVLKHYLPDLYDNYSPYRLIRNSIASGVSDMVSKYTFIDDFLCRLTRNIAFTEVTHHKRYKGRSSYTLMKLIKHGIYILLAYSKIVTWTGILTGSLMVSGFFMLMLNKFYSASFNTILISPDFIKGVVIAGLPAMMISLLFAYLNYRNFRRASEPLCITE